MPQYFAALTIVLLVGMVVTRVLQMMHQGIKALKFGSIDKKEFLIPPFALFYLYIVFAEVFSRPALSRQEFFRSVLTPWIGVAFCVGGLGLLLWSLVSFEQSFRIGISDISELDLTGLPGCSDIAVPSADLARRRISQETLWRGIRRLLQAGETLSMNAKESEVSRT